MIILLGCQRMKFGQKRMDICKLLIYVPMAELYVIETCTQLLIGSETPTS